MVYKLLFLLVFMSPHYNAFYNLENIECPRWVPGTNQMMPQHMTLSPALELQNKMRCYCEVVKQKERECIDRNVPRNICVQRTNDWVANNFTLQGQAPAGPNDFVPLPTRNVIINVE
jgi:hypothetical protein